MNSDKEIRKQFQSKLNDFTVPIPPDGWERVEETLNAITPIRKKVVRLKWLYVSSVAIVLLVLLVSILFLSNPLINDEPILTDKASTSVKSPTSLTPELPLVKETSDFSDEKFNEQHIGELLTKRSVKSSTPDEVKPTGSTDLINDLLTSYSSKRFISFKRVALNKMVDSYMKDMDIDDLIEEQLIITSGMNDLYADNNMIFADDNQLTLSVGGKGGLTSFYQSVNTPMTLRSASVKESDSYLEESGKMLLNANANLDNQSEMEHSQPVSFGVTVSKSIVNNLYVETGIVYSYLYSKTKNSSTSSQEYESQRLHYLGVPLNLNYNIISYKQLNVYSSVGGMIEKDIYGSLRNNKEGIPVLNINDGEKSESYKDKTISQRNPQLSVNVGLGLSYPVFKDLKLYGKIGGAYYFDANNRHKTIYSDRKIVMDLSLGLRYEFK